MSLFPKYLIPARSAEPAEPAEKDVNISNFSRKSRDCMDLINKTNELLNEIYPSSAIPWASEHKPDLMRYARGAECEVDKACLSGDLIELRGALERYQKAYTHIFEAYIDKGKGTERLPDENTRGMST